MLESVFSLCGNWREVLASVMDVLEDFRQTSGWEWCECGLTGA